MPPGREECGDEVEGAVCFHEVGDVGGVEVGRVWFLAGFWFLGRFGFAFLGLRGCSF
jgi:hypothetical protein